MFDNHQLVLARKRNLNLKINIPNKFTLDLFANYSIDSIRSVDCQISKQYKTMKMI